jgi:hypothetical protein
MTALKEILKMVRTNTPKALWTMAKVYHCPKKLL